MFIFNKPLHIGLYLLLTGGCEALKTPIQQGTRLWPLVLKSLICIGTKFINALFKGSIESEVCTFEKILTIL